MSSILDFQTEIEDKVKFIEQQTNLINNRQITPEGLSYAIANYNSINNFLINQYEIVSLENEELKDEWKIVWSDWFIKSKNKLNETRISSKFASATEIEAQALLDNREEYLQWKKKLNVSERRVSFFHRLTDAWKLQAQMLINLSMNMRSELSALSIENRANKDLTKEKIMRKIKQPKRDFDDNNYIDNEQELP